MQSGLLSPNWRHGRYCRDKYDRYLSGSLREMWKRQVNDPDQLSLRSEIALLRTLIAELLKKLKTGEGEGLWDRLFKTHRRMVLAIRDGNAEQMKRELGNMAEIIEKGGAHHEIRWQLQQAIKTLVMAEKGEWKRLHDLCQMVPRAVVEKMLLIENHLLLEVFKDRQLIKEYRRRCWEALLPILGVRGNNGHDQKHRNADEGS
jgi:hypothetical protein